jgi:hypothetical protein
MVLLVVVLELVMLVVNLTLGGSRCRLLGNLVLLHWLVTTTCRGRAVLEATAATIGVGLSSSVGCALSRPGNNGCEDRQAMPTWVEGRALSLRLPHSRLTRESPKNACVDRMVITRITGQRYTQGNESCQIPCVYVVRLLWSELQCFPTHNARRIRDRGKHAASGLSGRHRSAYKV